MFRVGFPGWKLAARWGVPLSLRVHIHYDDEGGVISYWANSPDLDGLVAAGSTLDELRDEVRGAVELLLEMTLNGHAPPARPDFRFKDAAIVAA